MPTNYNKNNNKITYKFIAKYIKIQTNFVEKGFETEIHIEEDLYEIARNKALEKAQSLLRDLEGAWFMRLEKK